MQSYLMPVVQHGFASYTTGGGIALQPDLIKQE